ncbi:pyridoxamine 5'-phosphate oxidase family protein [Yoonia sp.]|jgi:pyridoxamine 5'-phosphate oxidase|uniref:pyridoxamine 5'-phosphate oxidase family protein n=1 Tax=Yoonia sp. TaxID=2212373 RepID=UPI0025FB2C33|nr:pyridoxamine 5'-phosphate oxidase family protein [Yoonia sp.]
MSNWFETLEGLHIQVWDTLIQGLVDAGHPARRPTFATVSPDNWPEARTVVLRGSDTEAGIVSVYSDLHSDKIRSLKKNPRAALHIWDPAQALQIRLKTEVTIASGPAVRPLWENIPAQSRQSYGVSPAPGRPIPDALDYIKNAYPDTFAVLHCRIITIDVVHLGDDHRRASYSRSDDWAGKWLSP